MVSETVQLDPEAEALFENAPFGSTRKYLRALKRRRSSVMHHLHIITERREKTRSYMKDVARLQGMRKQISDLDTEISTIDKKWFSPSE